MQTIVLENQTQDGQTLQATFLPEAGMNMISFKKDDVEFIDTSTRYLFEERYAGFGALIGPHFHHRRPQVIPPIQYNENLFPHIARVKAKGIQEPFSHGIARYAPWKVEKSTIQEIKAVLTGKDTWNGVPLAELEGQNFKMQFAACLQPSNLSLHLAIVSDTDSLVGIHYYYALSNGKGRVTSRVQGQFRDHTSELKPIPSDWDFNTQQQLVYDLSKEADFTFRPYPNPTEGHILLETENYSLLTKYQCICEENSWQLYHPAGASFVCIEPLSAKDPRHPNLTVSSLNIQLFPL